MRINLQHGWLGKLSRLPVSSLFGPRWGKNHSGLDFAVPVRTPIFAPIDGKIAYIGMDENGYGLYLDLSWFKFSPSGHHILYTLRFAHLNEIPANIQVGTEVRELQLIAYTGGDVNDQPNAGHTTGPHLHFEIRFGSAKTPVDPLPYVLDECYSPNTGEILKKSDSVGAQDVRLAFDTKYGEDFDVSKYVVTHATEPIKRKEQVATGVNERLAPGIWQIVKLVMDSSVNKRQVIDSSISMMTGSLQNWFNKVCQQPFVEFSGDTYGDEYFFFVRKPPFDLEGINKGLQYRLEISNREIVSTTLTWNNQNIFSWYQLIPMAETMGMEQVALYLPAIFFPEYAAIWGSRDMTINSQYWSLFNREYGNFSEKEKKKMQESALFRNTISDLKYMIDCNAYAPFVRSGTITLNGDRRIKRGTFILMPNDEVFYVDSVSNSLSFHESSCVRTTTLNVSHGMFLPFINGRDCDGKKMSYFNLIDYGEGFDIKKINQDNYSDLISKWKVNLDTFTFFLRKTQLLYT